MKVQDQEGCVCGGFGAVVAGEHFSRSLERETRYGFWDRRPPPHALPLRELGRSSRPPSFQGPPGSPLLLCWVSGAWLLVLAREPSRRAQPPSLEPLIPETVSALCWLQAPLGESPGSPAFFFGLAWPSFGVSSSVLNCSGETTCSRRDGQGCVGGGGPGVASQLCLRLQVLCPQ